MHKGIVTRMLCQPRCVPTTIALGVAQLLTDLRAALTEPLELHRGQFPGNADMWWRMRYIVRRGRSHMASCARLSRDTRATEAGVDVHTMQSGPALPDNIPPRNIVCTNVAIGAARMGDNGLDALPCLQAIVLADAARRRHVAGGLLVVGG